MLIASFPAAGLGSELTGEAQMPHNFMSHRDLAS